MGSRHVQKLGLREAGAQTLHLDSAAPQLLRQAFGERLIPANLPTGKQLWDLDGNKELRRWKQKGDYVGALQFSPDGGRLAVASSQGTISIHDLAGGKAPVKMVGEPDLRKWLTFSPNGKMVAGSWQVRTSGSSQSSFRIWDATTGKVLHNIPGSFFASAFSPDGGTFAVSGFASAFSPDGGTFAVSGLETTYIYDTATGREVQRLPDCHQHIWALAFSPDGKMLATGQGQHIRLWNTENWQEISAESGHAGPLPRLRGTIIMICSFSLMRQPERRSPDSARITPAKVPLCSYRMANRC